MSYFIVHEHSKDKTQTPCAKCTVYNKIMSHKLSPKMHVYIYSIEHQQCARIATK